MGENGPIRIVCFDLGGVIIRIHYTWEDTCKSVGLAVRKEAHEPKRLAATRSVTEAFATGRLEEDLWAREMVSALDGLYSAEEVERIHEGWLRDQYPGIDDVVSILNETKGVCTACLSNTNPRHWRMMKERYPAVRMLQHRHASHLMGYAKPDTGIYEAFETAMQCDGPSILFFDDLEDNVAAARSRGWHAHQIDPAGDPADQVRTCLASYGLM
ncbi:MAG: HAD family hydrolase [Planctomycetes bacterium]|nr:HAD family hydrolase [Planctomycetota bacterium]NOG54958.1 HAD family hydrolase [Planctomycetota bacterium]